MQTTEAISLKSATIGELVSQDWRNAEIFKKYGIDFCCGGKRTVEEACTQAGIGSDTVEEDLRGVENRPTGVILPFNDWELDFLADFIVNTHHKYVKESVPFLEELSAKVGRVHGGRHPELVRIEGLLQEVTQELTQHMRKEEMILFPYIRQLAQTRRNGGSAAPPPFGTVANPIQMMESEHLSAGNAMEEIQQLSNQFTPPDEACTSYRVLFLKLKEFRDDLHQHVHLENNILFPKSLRLEEEVMIG